MRRLDGTIFCALATLAACGGSQETHAAKHSLYDADFTIVYTAALEATRTLYPTLDENVGPGRIQTAWHQVLFGSNSDDGDMNQRMTIPSASMVPGATGSPMGMGMSPAAAAGGMPSQLTNKRYFVRFDVSVVGGRPWRVKVVGHASEWDPGAAMPVEMRGANRPPWLDPRIEQLQVAIYKKISQYATPAHDEDGDDTKTAADEMPKTDPGEFKGVPPEAAKRLASLKDTLARRDYAALRPQLADDITWSLGGGTGADDAMATWQADPAQFDAMAAVLAAGCGADGARVRCPAGDPAPGAYQVVLEPRAGAWKMTSFVKAE
ncbi:MAG TPA: hypothetical protein VMJ10_17845 [Kofleriaceae bacterium]|nr:hypothetical protein [Kofleriaceae bacterium]